MHPAPDLVDLEAAGVVGARRVRGAAEEAGEAAYDAEVIAPRLLVQATHGHVFGHGLRACAGAAE